ncbi:uncharacterized protein LOC106661970 [Cimex lectularius]|uniref:Venom protein n=1 Tax=Cimex lectularius TaxID=79782 RepID=A0A8I6R8K4_CIMLE|nr:uncharacterized protein LOC106661970 [Cimex lectularius]
MISRILISSILLFLACEAKSEKRHPLEVRYEEWLRGKIELMNAQVQSAHNELKNDLISLISKSSEEIDEITDSHQSLLKSSGVGANCLEEGLKQLAEVKNSSKHSFFTCANLTTAMEDVGVIGWQVVNFVSKTLIYLDNILNGLSDCTWNYYLPPVKCYVSYVYTAISDMSRFMYDVKTLLNSISIRASDIKNQISYCKNGPKNQIVVMAKNVINNAHLCKRLSK